MRCSISVVSSALTGGRTRCRAPRTTCPCGRARRRSRSRRARAPRTVRRRGARARCPSIGSTMLRCTSPHPTVRMKPPKPSTVPMRVRIAAIGVGDAVAQQEPRLREVRVGRGPLVERRLGDLGAELGAVVAPATPRSPGCARRCAATRSCRRRRSHRGNAAHPRAPARRPDRSRAARLRSTPAAGSSANLRFLHAVCKNDPWPLTRPGPTRRRSPVDPASMRLTRRSRVATSD